MRITLNLATRPFADHGPALKRLRIAMGGLAVVSAALWLGLHALHNKAAAARARAQRLDTAIARVNGEQQRYIGMMKEPDNALLLRQTVALNKLFDEKAFSWTLAMENLETVLPGGVQVSTLEPAREKDGRITLKMRVLGPRDKAVEFVSNLEHSKRFYLPRIVNETAESNSGPGQQLEPVSDTNRFSFDLEAEYNPPSLEEIKAEQAAEKKPAAEASAAEEPPRRRAAEERAPGRPPYQGMSRRVRALPKPSPDGYGSPGGPR